MVTHPSTSMFNSIMIDTTLVLVIAVVKNQGDGNIILFLGI